MQTEYPHNTSWQHAPEQPYPIIPPQPPAPQPGVIWLPPVANDRSGLRMMGGLWVALALFLGFFYIPANFGSAPSNFVEWVGSISVLLYPGFCLVLGIRMLLLAQRWPIVNQRRQAAAAWGFASGVPLAEPRPFPNIEALPLPFTIKLKRNWLTSTVLFCSTMGLYGLLVLSENTINTLLYYWPFWLVFVSLLAFIVVWVTLPQSIEVAAQGLIIRHPMRDWFKTSSGPYWKWEIPWSDIRLFAIREGKPGAAKVRYELSSPLKVVTFSRIVRPRWWSLYRPAQPFGEYNAQMDALLAFVSARTGLLLYDVR